MNVRPRQAIEQRVIERTVNRSTDPARQIRPRRLRQAKLPLHIGVGIAARHICALLLEWGGPPRLHANARGPQRVAGAPGLVRSEARRVGEEGFSPWRCRSPSHTY